ncbi:MAG: putative ABC transport system permease protein [Verrucomicrobiales bacterium]|jgi:putative ABC transport system permease protein
MSFWNLVKRGITYYWRWHIGLLIGVAITSAIVSGSLIVGDSVRATLKRQNDQRLGKVDVALIGGDRFFTEQLVADTSNQATVTAGILMLRGTLSTVSGGQRINNVNVIGVTPEFWKLGEEAGEQPGDGVLINEPLAATYDIATGDTIIIRLEKPGALSRDAPLSGSKEDLVTLRDAVAGVAAADLGGNFSLRAEQLPPLNVFVPLEKLQELTEEEGRVNLMLDTTPEVYGDDKTLKAKGFALQDYWQLADAEAALESVEDGKTWNLTSSRIFIDPVLEQATMSVIPDAMPVATYLVNRIDSGENVTPYSMVTALPRGYREVLPDDTADDEAVISQWLADDLGIGPGDSLTLHYFVMDDGRALKEQPTTFTVKAVLPMTHAAINGSWTPEFPGVSDEDNCSDWNPGYEVDFNQIREKDEDYWDTYKSTPKVFITKEKGLEMWANRFGNVTGIRFSADNLDEAAFLAKLKQELTVASFGLNLVNLREGAKQAVAKALPLEQYFLAFGFFLILTALILSALLFLFSIENRSGQIGVLSAVGIPQKTVRKLFIVEGVGIAVIGAALGLFGGVLYTKFILSQLSSDWSGAVAGLKFQFAMNPLSLVFAFFGTVLMAWLTVFLASRRILKTQPKDLLAGVQVQAKAWSRKTQRIVWSSVLFFGLATILGMGFTALSTDAMVGAWFFGGATLLVFGLLVTWSILRRAGNQATTDGHVSIWQMGMRNAVRKPGRSLAIAGVLAAGIFMITVVNLFRQDANRDATDRTAGTGGFAFVGDSSMPIYEDLNTEAGREAYSIDAEEMEGSSVVPFRVQDGDEASCLNLNHAQIPTVAGVDPTDLASRGAFSFKSVSDLVSVAEGESPWTALDAKLDGDAVPAVMDANSAMYALKVKLGDTIPYVDGKGNTVPIKLVGTLNNALLQGKVVISEANFISHFPDAEGYHYFLIDSQPDKAEALTATLTKQLGLRGLSLTPAAARLAQFNAVQNTYIGIFSTLGAFALVLSTVGLGILVARNVLERRAEFGTLQAIGFRKPALQRIVLGEHWFLLLAGVVIGLLSAVIAVWPMLGTGSAGVPYGIIGLLAGGILIGGLLFCWLAATAALRMPLLDAIRKE